MALSAKQEHNKAYLKSLLSARVDELMPDNATEQAPYEFIEQELDMASEFILTRASKTQVFPAVVSGAGLSVISDDEHSSMKIPLVSSFLRFIRLKLGGWSRPIDELHDIDSAEYAKQFYAMSRGSSAKPIGFLVPYLGETTLEAGEQIVFRLNYTDYVTGLSDYQKIFYEISYTNPNTGVLHSIQSYYGVVSFIESNADMIALLEPVYDALTGALPDFELAFNPNGDITLTSLNTDVNGSSIRLSVLAEAQFTNTQPLVLTGKPANGTYSITRNGGIPVGDYTIGNEDTPASHAMKIINLLSPLSGTNLITPVTSPMAGYPVVLRFDNSTQATLQGSTGDLIERESTNTHIWVRPSTFIPIAGYTRVTEELLSLYESSGQAIECYSGGDGTIEQFLYVPKLSYYDVPKSLWDAMVWYASSRVLTALKQTNPATIAYEYAIQSLAGKQVGIKPLTPTGDRNGRNDR